MQNKTRLASIVDRKDLKPRLTGTGERPHLVPLPKNKVRIFRTIDMKFRSLRSNTAAPVTIYAAGNHRVIAGCDLKNGLNLTRGATRINVPVLEEGQFHRLRAEVVDCR